MENKENNENSVVQHNVWLIVELALFSVKYFQTNKEHLASFSLYHLHAFPY